jgi:hypothetical protein
MPHSRAPFAERLSVRRSSGALADARHASAAGAGMAP